MDNYKIDTIGVSDIDKVIDIYNSNANFLENHIGVGVVSKDFIVNEIEEMKSIGFKSLVIKNSRDEIVGICDFKITEEVYLSLLMLHNKQKRNKLGSKIYTHLEKLFKEANANRVRIDVVYDYEENVVGFWEKQGFVHCEKIQLEWNGYKSNAIKMYKNI